MIVAAEAALRYWKQAGTWLEEERAEYRLAKSLLIAGRAVDAVASARRCLAVCERHEAPAFERSSRGPWSRRRSTRRVATPPLRTQARVVAHASTGCRRTTRRPARRRCRRCRDPRRRDVPAARAPRCREHRHRHSRVRRRRCRRARRALARDEHRSLSVRRGAPASHPGRRTALLRAHGARDVSRVRGGAQRRARRADGARKAAGSASSRCSPGIGVAASAARCSRSRARDHRRSCGSSRSHATHAARALYEAEGFVAVREGRSPSPEDGARRRVSLDAGRASAERRAARRSARLSRAARVP